MVDNEKIEDMFENTTNYINGQLDKAEKELAKATPQELAEAKAAINANPEMLAKLKGFGIDIDSIL